MKWERCLCCCLFVLFVRTGGVLGRDFINLKCCAGPVRDAKKRRRLASLGMYMCEYRKLALYLLSIANKAN